MKRHLEELIATLRDELTECGELLALLQEQQSLIIARSTEGLLKNIGQIDAQFAKASAIHELREERQRQYAVELGFPAGSSFGDMSVRVGAEYRPVLAVLIDEVHGVMDSLQRLLRQNHRLLARSLDLLQQLMKGLFPPRLAPSMSAAAR